LQIEREYRRQQQVRESFNTTQMSMVASKQNEMEERSMKKRFGEIEEKIRVTINEREEAQERLKEC